MKKVIITLGAIAGTLVLVIFIYLMVSSVSGILVLFGFNPPKPEITHGEFPFQLVYEIDGVTKVVEDVLICDFAGFGFSAASGKFRHWKSHLASGNTRITLFQSDEIEIFYTPDINQHAAAVYMGDTEIYSGINEVFPDAWYTTDFENKQENAYIIFAEDMWENYKLRLINWKIAPPIQNSFK